MSPETQIHLLQALLSSKSENEILSCDELIAEIRKYENPTPIETNLIIRCAEYDLLPRKRLSNQTEVNRYVYSTSTTLEQNHGIEKKYALQIAGGIATAYSSFDVQVAVDANPKPMGIKLSSGVVTSTGPNTHSGSTTISPNNTQKEKKGLLSFLKKK